MLDESDITTLWVFLTSILACQLVLVMIDILHLTRAFIAVFKTKYSKKGGGMKGGR